MIFVDSNIPMYLVGASHPRKVDARRVLEELVVEGRRLVSDAEVLQEILHRYAAIDRRDAIQPAFDALLEAVDEVYPVDPSDVHGARDILMGNLGISARDAIHLAVMRRHSVDTILTFDQGFRSYPGVTCLGA